MLKSFDQQLPGPEPQISPRTPREGWDRAGNQRCWFARPLRMALFVGLFCGLMTIQEEWFSGAKGVTFDETFYLNAGVLACRQGDWGVLSGHGAAPLPVLLVHWTGALCSSQERASRSTVWSLHPGDRRTIHFARRVHLGIVFAALGLVYSWLAKRRGELAAVSGAAMLCLSPVVTSSAVVAGTDFTFCLMLLVTLWVTAAYHERPTLPGYASVVLAFGLAVASKVSALLIVPVLATAMLGTSRRSAIGRRRSWLRAAVVAALAMTGILAGAAAVLAALYGGDWQAVVDSLRFQWFHNQRGRFAFLCGELSGEGWWYYFPIAFLVKSTPAELMLAVVGLALVPRFVFRQMKQDASDATGWLWLGALACIVLFALNCRINIGIRYILPLYPLLIVWTVDQAFLAARGWGRLLGVGCLLLIGLQAWAAWQIAPDYLSYFNRLAGGPKQGYRWLADSNLDWGQDLPLVRDTVARMPGRRLLLSYFGTDNPDHHGIERVDWERATGAEAATCDVLAVSATYLAGCYSEGADPFRDFRLAEPVARAGYSVFFFDLRTPEGSAALQTALARRPDHRDER